MPTIALGFSSLTRAAKRASLLKEGVLVWMMIALVILGERRHLLDASNRSGGASISLLPGTIAAGCASHVGYQNDCTSRRH